MSKYIVETFYTCAFKITHKLDELNEKKLSELENRTDGEVKIIDVKLNNRKTKTTNKKDGISKPLSDLNKERYIDVIITRLRKKIEADPKTPKYLQTLRGVGYVLWIE